MHEGYVFLRRTFFAYENRGRANILEIAHSFYDEILIVDAGGWFLSYWKLFRYGKKEYLYKNINFCVLIVRLSVVKITPCV